MLKNKIPKPSLNRITCYLRFLNDIKKNNQGTVSSIDIANYMGLKPIVVKKDLAFITSHDGKPKVGYKTEQLINDIKKSLHYDIVTNAIIVGMGKLGATLMSYQGFERYGLNIVAGFDAHPSVVGTVVNAKRVMPINDLKRIIENNDVRIGIITVQRESAQLVCDQLVAAGIKAIWTFAPIHLNVPSKIPVKYEDMAASLSFLSNQIKVIKKRG
ncbi:MAG: redox-sensing transcriptional repressor Rex [Mycoplasmataceae bacterium]|jgi:redox-sensing transcriptional repressor|nr:redox-sensing transcriptional repressor Rex [Mycoplasmataceae bacterium]